MIYVSKRTVSFVCRLVVSLCPSSSTGEIGPRRFGRCHGFDRLYGSEQREFRLWRRPRTRLWNYNTQGSVLEIQPRLYDKPKCTVPWMVDATTKNMVDNTESFGIGHGTDGTKQKQGQHQSIAHAAFEGRQVLTKMLPAEALPRESIVPFNLSPLTQSSSLCCHCECQQRVD